MVKVVLVNGKPGVGKSEFERTVRNNVAFIWKDG